MTTLYDMKSIIRREMKKAKVKLLYIKEDFNTHSIYVYALPETSRIGNFTEAMTKIWGHKSMGVNLVWCDIRTDKKFIFISTAILPDNSFLLEMKPFEPEKEEINLLRKTVENCRQQFESYVASHMAKNPPDFGKAAKNYEFMLRCNYALDKNK